VVHGEDDRRFPPEQGMRLYVELKRRGVPAELLLFPGEGSDLGRTGRPRHRQARLEHLLRWWARWLPVAPDDDPDTLAGDAGGEPLVVRATRLD
jgi:dipeptidyl aminopeptidase/acylaminoacyl peptidase